MTSAFNNRAECYVDQYSKYNVTETTTVLDGISNQPTQ